MAPKLPIYLDHNATTPVDPLVLQAMLPYFSQHFGNAASRSHAFGWRAESAVTEARERLASALGATAREIVFTSGATESNNLAILGAARALRGKGDHVVTSSIEHRAVLDPCRALEAEGFRVTFVPPDPFGMTSAGAVTAALGPKTVLVSVMAANNEIGTLNPIAAIGRLCKERGVLFHTDAVQAFGKIPLDVHSMGVDLLSITAHKLYGPKGVGALYVRASNPRVKLLPLLHGGGHEKGLRPGTLDVPGIVGFGAAARISLAAMGEEQPRLARLRDRLHEALRARLPGVTLNGSPTERLAGNLNLSFAGVASDALMMAVRDLAVSSGSACTSASIEPSHVLGGLGLSKEAAHSSIRFGVGRFNTEEEIDFAIEAVAEAVRRLRAEREA
jgi:cysteine desulfurase